MNYVSTDVDRILEYVKGRKKAELIEVSRALGMKAMEVDKWAKILEKQGLLQIQYDITKMYLVWNEREEKQDPVDKYVHDLEAAKPPAPSMPKKQGSDETKIISPSPKKKDMGFIHGGAFNLFILGRKSDLKRSDATVQPKDAELKMTQKAVIPVQTLPKRVDEKKAIKEITIPTESKKEAPSRSFSLPFLSRSPSQKQAPDGDVDKAVPAQLLKDKVDAINATIAEIATLNAEKEKLYATEYTALISRLESHLSVLSDKTSEKEGSINTLHKRIADLSEKIFSLQHELQESSKKIDELEAYYNKKLESLSQLRKLSQNYQQELTALTNEIEEGHMNKYLSELKKIGQEYEAKAVALSRKNEEVEARLKAARDRLQHLLKESKALSRKFEEDI